MNVIMINKVKLVASLEPAAATNCAIAFSGNRLSHNVITVRRPLNAEDVTDMRCSIPNLRRKTLDELFDALVIGPLTIRDTRNVARYILSIVIPEEPLVYVDSFGQEPQSLYDMVVNEKQSEPQRDLPLNALSIMAPSLDDTYVERLRNLLSVLVDDLHWANYDITFTFGVTALDAYLVMPPVEQDGWVLACSQIHYKCGYIFSEDKLVSFTFGAYSVACPEGFTKQTLRDAIVRCFNVMPDLLSMQKQKHVAPLTGL